MWLVELGYQTDIAGRVVLGIALGAMGVIDARSRLTPSGAFPEQSLLSQTEEAVDQHLERYGVLPTLTLRLGFDLI
jgi:hypothetical protein